jgi:hypothetical protein
MVGQGMLNDHERWVLQNGHWMHHHAIRLQAAPYAGCHQWLYIIACNAEKQAQFTTLWAEKIVLFSEKWPDYTINI